MARKLITLLAASLAALVAAPTASAELHSRDWGARFAQREALVRFEPGVEAAGRREARDDAGVEFEESLLVPRLQVVTFDGSVKSAVGRLERQPAWPTRSRTFSTARSPFPTTPTRPCNGGSSPLRASVWPPPGRARRERGR